MVRQLIQLVHLGPDRLPSFILNLQRIRPGDVQHFLHRDGTSENLRSERILAVVRHHHDDLRAVRPRLDHTLGALRARPPDRLHLRPQRHAERRQNRALPASVLPRDVIDPRPELDDAIRVTHEVVHRHAHEGAGDAREVHLADPLLLRHDDPNDDDDDDGGERARARV